MTDEELFRLWILFRRPIYWDPAPPWLKLSADKLRKFAEVQKTWNTKIAEIEVQRMQEIAKVVGIQGM